MPRGLFLLVLIVVLFLNTACQQNAVSRDLSSWLQLLHNNNLPGKLEAGRPYDLFETTRPLPRRLRR